MSVNSISQLLAANYTSFLSDNPKSIDITLKPNEVISAKDFLQKVVMQALGTDNAEKADDFIKQSGLKLENLPTAKISPNGEKTFSFETKEDFWNSVKSFNETGKALQIEQPKNPLAPAKEKPQKPEQTEVNFPKLVPKTTPQPNSKPKAQPNASQKQTPNRPQKTILYAFEDGKKKGAEVSFSAAKMGADGKRVRVPLSMQDLIEIKNNTKDGDSRLELLTKALQKLGYSDTAIQNLLAQEGITNDANSGVELPNNSKNEKQDINSWLDKTIGAWKESNNINSVNFDKTPVASGMTLDASLRQRAYLEDLKAKGDTVGAREFGLQLKIQDRLKQIDAEFDKMPAGNDLQKSFRELARENAKKDAIDQITNEANLDLRSNNTQNEQIGNGFADGLEKTMRFLVDHHPIYGFLPEEARKQIANFGVGIGKGTVQLAGMGIGVQNFFRDAAQDLLISATEKSGLDKKLGIDLAPFKQGLNQVRQQEQDLWKNLMNARTKDMANGDFAYQTKKDNGLRTTLWDVPNWAVRGGEMTAKAIPFIAVAAATGGASIPVQVAVTAGVSGTMALGENYAQTGDRVSSLKSAAWGAAQGATGPLTSRLPFLSGVAADAAFGYTFAKLQNPKADDNEIVQSIMLQTSQAGAFRLGSKLHETFSQQAGKNLSEAEVKQKFEQQIRENLGTIKEEVAISAKNQAENFVKQTEIETVTKNLEQQGKQRNSNLPSDLVSKGNQIRNRIAQQSQEIVSNWGSKNKVFTKEMNQKATKTLMQKELYALPLGVVPPDKMIALGIKAGHHIEAGATAFKDFAKMMQAEVKNAGLNWKDVRGQIENMYRDAIDKLNQTKDAGKQIPIDEKGISSMQKVFKQQALDEAKPLSRFDEIQKFRKQNDLPEYQYDKPTGTVAFTEIKGQKVFGTNTTLGAEKLGGNNRALREKTLQRIQNELGELQGIKYGTPNKTMFLTHAEAEALIKTAEKFGGKLPKEVTLYVDRITCGECQEGLPLLLKLYGIDKLTVRDSHGYVYSITSEGTKRVP